MTKGGVKGRGASQNPGNRFEKLELKSAAEWDFYGEDPSTLPSPKTQFYKDNSKTILSTNDSPDVGFRYSMNAYRGCEHGCIYCYARPTHEYLGMSAGLDFESKIIVKEQAPELLRKELCKPSWQPEVIIMSGVTDCYQPAERKYQLTRKLLQVLLEFGNPVVLITKNQLVVRDLDILKPLAEKNLVAVILSITTLDEKLCGILEPRTSRPHARLETVKILSEYAVPVGVNVAPIIPGLTDHETPSILKAARKRGAIFAGYTIVRLPFGVKDLFQDWLAVHYPDRKNKVLSHIQDVRGGKLNESQFGNRMRGQGEFAEQIHQMFSLWRRKLGYKEAPELATVQFHRPHNAQGQLEMF